MATILIVEDDPLNLKKGVALLNQLGHEVMAAQNGAQAAQLIRRQLPDAILLDVNLPDTNGFDFAKKLKSHPRTQPIPIGFITSCDKAEDLRSGFASGGQVYLTKPYNAQAFTTVMTSLLPPRTSK